MTNKTEQAFNARAEFEDYNDAVKAEYQSCSKQVIQWIAGDDARFALTMNRDRLLRLEGEVKAYEFAHKYICADLEDDDFSDYDRFNAAITAINFEKARFMKEHNQKYLEGYANAIRMLQETREKISDNYSPYPKDAE